MAYLFEYYINLFIKTFENVTIYLCKIRSFCKKNNFTKGGEIYQKDIQTSFFVVFSSPGSIKKIAVRL